MRASNLILLVSIVLSVFSCNTSYRMVTSVKKNGTVKREVYARADSAFLAGDKSKNPFLFDFSDWNLSILAYPIENELFGKKEKFNVKIEKEVSSLGLYSESVKYAPEVKTFVTPKESLSKKFKWFYTYYTFQCNYAKLQYYAPISIDKYLTKEEQILWTQGNLSGYSILNGFEMADLLSGLEEKFTKWYSHNCFELSIIELEKIARTGIIDNEEKEKIFTKLYDQKKDDICPEITYDALDKYYSTNYYSNFYLTYKDSINNGFDQATSIIDYIGITIRYELLVPGTLINSNTQVDEQGTLIWKVDGMRLLFNDYTLTAEYRNPNIWSFVVSILVAIVAIISSIAIVRKKRLY